MQKVIAKTIMIVLVLCLLSAAAVASPVPDEVPDDFGGKTFYGYLVGLRDEYLPAKVFTDPTAYSDEDRENARRAARLIVEAVTRSFEEKGTEDQYNIYLRGYAYEQQFLDTKDPALRIKALDDYGKAIEMGSVFAQTDYDRVEAIEIQAGPLDWQIPQMLTADDVGGIVGDSDLFFMYTPYATEDNARLGVGYALSTQPDPTASAIFVLVERQGGHYRFDVLKRTAFLGATTDISGLGDAAFAMGVRNTFQDPLLYRTVVVMSGDMVIQVRVPDFVWRGPGFNMDPAKIASDIAAKLLQNLSDTEREVPGMESVVIEDLKPIPALTSTDPVSSIPDTLPDDLGGKTTYGYIVELRQTYLPADIFSSESYTEQAREDARKAMRLIVRTISDELDANGPDPYNLEIRAFCYYLALEDTDNPLFRHLAINDYKQALHLGYSVVRADYNYLARPLLMDMAQGIAEGSDAYLSQLQNWLIQAGYLAEPVSADATAEAVKTLEEELSFTVDGIADIDLLLALYARIDDGDWLYFAE